MSRIDTIGGQGVRVDVHRPSAHSPSPIGFSPMGAMERALDATSSLLRDVIEGRIRHLRRGRCPDEVEGPHVRDPECPACAIAPIAPTTGRGPFIATITGGVWYVYDPRPEDVRLDDQRALAYVPRFLGHCGCTYSVLQHQVHVAEWLSEQGADAATVREGLAHDGHEVYPPGDVPTPCKRGDHPYAATIRAWEERVASAFRHALGLPLQTSGHVREADRVLLSTEIRDLNPAWPGEIAWGPLPESWHRRPLTPWSPKAAWCWWRTLWRKVGGADV